MFTHKKERKSRQVEKVRRDFKMLGQIGSIRCDIERLIRPDLPDPAKGSFLVTEQRRINAARFAGLLIGEWYNDDASRNPEAELGTRYSLTLTGLLSSEFGPIQIVYISDTELTLANASAANVCGTLDQAREAFAETQFYLEQLN